MSYQPAHNVQEFVPTYTVRSEYLPTNRVIEGNQGQVSEWVIIKFISAQKV